MPYSTWDSPAEQDLFLALMGYRRAGDEKIIKPNWIEVHQTMTDWGYNFSRDAMT